MQADPLKDSLFSAENQIQSNMEINHPIHSDYYSKYLLFFRMLWSVFLVTCPNTLKKSFLVKQIDHLPKSMYLVIAIPWFIADVGSSHVVRVIEQCCFNSVSDWLF